MQYRHETVLREETVHYLRAAQGGIFIDGTLGGGGHTQAILQAHPETRVIGIDRDPEALCASKQRLAPYGARVKLTHGNFADLPELVKSWVPEGVDGVVLDIGVSSFQLDQARRGFSYWHDAPLDMRMDPQQSRTAADIVNTASEEELSRILRHFGEERWAARIASFIVRERQREAITTTAQLTQLVKDAIPARARRVGPHPARRTFQALRIAVNDELGNLERGLNAALKVLRSGARLVVITFHSLEDTLVKNFFRSQANPCNCPPRLGCVCGQVPQLRIVTTKGVRPSPAELKKNPRARSATLRAAERVLSAEENA
ncbi:MAG: 16S rRNA (cytosine(1402)-N(4))-methyltransferase RsmH [Limnochordia bacterium]|jgi:16S rRNA (cytosine1402-N4)-methyltransferase